MAGLHHRGTYPARARALRQAANADPRTVCWRCGLTLAQHPAGATWDAGHVEPGRINGELRPEASTCNRSAGAAEGNRRRIGLRTTREW